MMKDQIYISPYYSRDYALRQLKINHLREYQESIKNSDPILTRVNSMQWTVSTADKSKLHSSKRVFGYQLPYSASRWRLEREDKIRRQQKRSLSVDSGRERRKKYESTEFTKLQFEAFKEVLHENDMVSRAPRPWLPTAPRITRSLLMLNCNKYFLFQKIIFKKNFLI
jgi:hypothetical protein